MRRWIGFCLLAVLSWSPVAAGDDPAALAWKDLTGETHTLEKYEGRIVVLNFWATWCEPCKKEMPDLVRIQNRFGMYGVQVLGAAADPEETGPNVAAFARKLKINFPVLLGATTPQMEELGAGLSLPATVVLDPHGHVIERISGVFDRKELEATLSRMVQLGLGDEHEGELVADAGHKHSHDHDHGHRGSGTEASLVPS